MAKPPPPTIPTDLDDYSTSSTLITFDHSLPLLRQPIPAGPSDEPSAGPFLLAFKDPQSWASACKSTHSRITQQCESGARIGCSIAASNSCKPPWWKALVGPSKSDFAKRAECEELEMAKCVKASKESCGKFATDKCLPAFRGARIAVNEGHVNLKGALKLIHWASFPKEGARVRLLGLEGDWVDFKRLVEGTGCRGEESLGSGMGILNSM
ncbi:hypothetical protein RJ639_031509 [Escallonia herrerae]|uniref:Uncharacterized protein n=1 Tax=Escallonia herrerae TaxID=1293975 RepID=A0AA88WYZ0_9ASTE|nr:hypothetical protein RJ639_031509 [Escallonia herrerae]